MNLFEPKAINMFNITIRIEEKMLEYIDVISYKKGMSRNEFIKQALEFSLKNMKRGD